MTQRRIGNKETVDLKKDPQLPVAVEAAEKSLKKGSQFPTVVEVAEKNRKKGPQLHVAEEAAEKSLKKGPQFPAVVEAAEKAELMTGILTLSLQQQLDHQQQLDIAGSPETQKNQRDTLEVISAVQTQRRGLYIENLRGLHVKDIPLWSEGSDTEFISVNV